MPPEPKRRFAGRTPMRSLLRFRDERTGASSTELRDVAGGKRVDVEALAAYLCQDAPLDPARTFYRDVRNELLPGVWRIGPKGPAFERRARDEHEAAERVRTVLTHVIEHAIGDCRRVAVFASGGLDSSVVMALAAEIMARKGGSLFALAIDFESPGDDRPHLAALEAHLKCEVIRIAPRGGAPYVEQVRTGVDAAPMLWPFSPLQLALFAAARAHGAERIITGVGGDDFFDGSPRALAGLLGRDPRTAVVRARALEGFDPVRFPVLEYLVRPLVVPLVPIALRRARARRTLRPLQRLPWAGPKLREVATALAARNLETTLAGVTQREPRAKFALPGNRFFAWLLHQEQRAGMLDRYDPMFTEEVADVLATIPADMLLAGNRWKGLLRECARAKLPESLLNRLDKADFAPAFPPFLEAVGGLDAFAEELEGRSLAKLGLADPSRFRAEIGAALQAPQQDGRYGYAWAALAAEAFLMRHPEVL